MKADKVRLILNMFKDEQRQIKEAYKELEELEAKAQSCDYWHNQYLELQKQINQADGFSYSE